MLIIPWKPAFKKSGSGQTGELYLNLPKLLIIRQKINVENNACFHYLDSDLFRLIDASICCTVADAGTQLANFDSSAPQKQLLIFHAT